MTTEVALSNRDALPDPLRVLIKEFPRQGWEENPNYSQLIAFWLDRHLMFRRLLAQLQSDAETAIDRDLAPDRYKRQLAQYGGMLINQLHGHHQIEDMQYFPVMSRLDKRVREGFDILDADHHALDGILAGLTDAANGVLQAKDKKMVDPLAKLHASLTDFAPMLDRHLVDEEELVVPVLLKYAPPEFR